MIGLFIGLILLIVILIFVFVLLPAEVDSFFNELERIEDQAKATETANELKPRIEEQETICNLRIKVDAQITQDLGIGAPEITIDTSDPRTYTWFKCTNNSMSVYFFDLFNLTTDKTPPTVFNIEGETYTKSDLSKFDFVSFGETISVEIVLRDKNDLSQKIDAFTQPQLARLIEIPEGLVKTPFDASIEFVATNIPDRDYVLEIYYGRSINDMEAGVPLLSEVCQIGKSTC